MRITNSLIAHRLLQDISRNLERLSKVQLQLSTAKRLNEPSDDPVGAARTISLRSTLEALEGWKRTGEWAQALLSATGQALDQIREILAQAKEVALRGLDPSISAQDRQVLAGQVNLLLEGLLALSNTRFADRYLFGGIQTTSPPFTATRDAQGEIVAVVANPLGVEGTIPFEVAEGVTLAVNAPGDEVFQQPVDLFQILVDLREDLVADNPSGIGTALDRIEAGTDQVLAAAGEVGVRIGRLEGIMAGLDQDLLLVKTLLSQTEDADLAELFVVLSQREQVYQASLFAGARLVQPNLLDFLR